VWPGSTSGSPKSQVDGEGGVEAVARRCSEAAAESGGRREWQRGPAAGEGKREDVAGLQREKKWRRGGAHREYESAAALRPNPAGSRELR
jgi:hypothetical protein